MSSNVLISRQMLRTKEAAKYTGIAKSTLEKLRVHGGVADTFRSVEPYSTTPMISMDGLPHIVENRLPSSVPDMAKLRRPRRAGIRVHRNYTVDEAAKLTGYSKGTIRRRIKANTLPAIVDQRPHLILGYDIVEMLRAGESEVPTAVRQV